MDPSCDLRGDYREHIQDHQELAQIFFLWKCQGKNLHGDESSGDENSAMKVPSSNLRAKNMAFTLPARSGTRLDPRHEIGFDQIPSILAWYLNPKGQSQTTHNHGKDRRNSQGVKQNGGKNIGINYVVFRYRISATSHPFHQHCVYY